MAKQLLGFLVACLMMTGCTTAHTEEPAAGPLKVGEKGADFTLKSLAGDEVSLKSKLAEGPVVLVVLRGFPGYQCPVCTKQVGELIGKAKELQALQAQVLLVYPGPANKLLERAQEFVGTKALPEGFTMLIDPDYTFTNDYHLRWDKSGETAYPSTFVLDQQGQATFALVSKSHGGRAKTDDILAALKK